MVWSTETLVSNHQPTFWVPARPLWTLRMNENLHYVGL